MKAGFYKRWSNILSPEGLISRAILLAVVFMLLNMAGLRDYTSYLCGTFNTPGVMSRWSVFLGAIYMLGYLGAVVVAPILLMAAMLYAWITRRVFRNSSG
ncbi:MAG: hypothetical protein V2A34_04125 [Lentisphaerota bacterium]